MIDQDDDRPIRVRTRQSFGDLAISTISGIDTVGGIQGTLLQHDRGYFSLSAQLIDAMMRDDRISGVTSTRTGALISSPVECKPAGTNRKATTAAELIGGTEGNDDDPGLWEQIFPSPMVRQMSFWGATLGFALGEIIWDTQAAPLGGKGGPSWLPRLKVWHPQFVYWDWADSRYVVLTREGVVPLPRVDDSPQSDGKWVVWTPYGYKYGWLHALVRSLSDKYLMRQWDYRDWARYNERHGMPILKGMYPVDCDKQIKDDFQRSLANIHAEAVIGLPQLPKDKGSFDVKYEEAIAKTHETFQLFKKEIDTDIAIAVLGQNLTTEGGTTGGSRALGQIQNLIRIDKALEDARLGQCLRDQVLTHWARFNLGDPELAPRVKYAVEPPDDEATENAALKMLGDALGSFKTAGAPIDVRAILDHAGVPMISEEEQAAQEAIAAEEARAVAAAGGAGGGDDGTGGPPAGGKKPGAAQLSARVPLPVPVKRYEFQGLPIAVENEAGSLRMWRDPGPEGGTVGTTTMLHDYGFIEGHLGGDDEEIDCYVGPDANAPNVHVVHQLKAPDFKAYDEDKVMLGFPDATAAHDAYLAHRSDTRAFGGMSVVPLAQFKRKLKRRTGTGRVRASADLGIHAALLRLMDRAGDHVHLRADRSPTGQRRARLYADRVADRAKSLAARAIAPDLAGLKAAIDAATSFTDLRDRIKGKYRDMDPDRLARIVQSARLMANLGGRLTAVQEI